MPAPSLSPSRVFRVSSVFLLPLASSLTPLAFAPLASAQEARSRPVGYLTQTIPSGQTRSFSIPFDADVSSQSSSVGKLTAVGPNFLENSAATWTPGAFSTAEAPYFVRLTSGPHTGRTFRIVTPANTATRLHIADDGLGLDSLALATGTDGTRFEILPADTLATFFGTGANVVVHGAADPLQADIVQVWGGAAWLNFYYNTTWNRWARDTDVVGDPSRNAFLLRPDRGLMITRRAPTALELVVTGRVLDTPQRAFHSRTDNALTFLATMQARDVTLGELALQSPSRSLNWRGATDSADADLLLVWSGATWFSFYYHTGNARWERVGDPGNNRDTYLLKAGTPVFVQRKGTGASPDDKTLTFPSNS